MPDTIHDLARRLREAAPGCLIHCRLPDDEPGGSITDTQGLTSLEQVELAVQILMAWGEDEGLDYDEVFGSMTLANLCERMAMIDDEPVHIAAACQHCAHAIIHGPREAGCVLCAMHGDAPGAVVPRTLVCSEFTPRVRVVD